MPSYQIADRNGLKWGMLTSHIALDANAPALLGAALDVSVIGMNLVELELLACASTSYTDAVRTALYMYFGVPLTATKSQADEVALAVKSNFATTRQGLEDAKGETDIRQNEDGTGDSLNGYVRATNLWGGRGPIHINFPRLLRGNLQQGAICWSALVVHEATHKYIATTDLIGKVKVGNVKKDGYLGGDFTNCVAKFDEYKDGRDNPTARRMVVGEKANVITTEQHLTNADSYGWFFTAMLQGDEATLTRARRFTAVLADMKKAVAEFEKAQRKALPDLMAQYATYPAFA